MFSKNLIHFIKQSSGTIVSGFKNKIYYPLAICKAWLLAFPKPTFSLFAIKVTEGFFGCKYAIQLSVELLSTTIISASNGAIALLTEQRHCSKKYFTL